MPSHTVPYSRMRMYQRTVAASWRTFGLGYTFLENAIGRPVFKGSNLLAMGLDNLFFPGHRKVEVHKPVLIVGHPRSGTTFLHRLLTQTREFSVFETWEILLPSLTARALARPLVRRLIQRGKGTLFPKKVGHHSALAEVEEEELLFFHTGNTQFVSCLSPLAFSDADFEELVYADDQPANERRKAMAFLKACFQRQIYQTGKPRIVAKMNYSGMRVRSLVEAFPDAKIVYVARSPLETIPSHLSLHRNMFDHMWGLDRIGPEALSRYYERRYRHNIAFYRYLEDVIESGVLPPDQFMVLPYDALREDLAGTVDRVIEFAELPVSDELRERIVRESGEQKSYQREHKNSKLEEFGLSKQRVLDDFAFVFDKYGFAR